MEITCDIFGEPCRGRGGAGSRKLGHPAHHRGRLAHLAQNTPKMPISTEVDCTLSTHPTIEGESKETTMHLRSAPLRSTHTQLRTGITARAGNWLVARNEANS